MACRPAFLVLAPLRGFAMGDPWGEGELPVLTVNLSAYVIGQYKATNAEYASMLQRTGPPYHGLESCCDTATWVCDFTKTGYHLPTEAQWERQLQLPHRPHDDLRWGYRSSALLPALAVQTGRTRPGDDGE